jgi:hypothetical protein
MARLYDKIVGNKHYEINIKENEEPYLVYIRRDGVSEKKSLTTDLYNDLRNQNFGCNNIIINDNGKKSYYQSLTEEQKNEILQYIEVYALPK